MDKSGRKIYQGDCLEVMKTFPDESINCCMTSPPYWALRDYGTANWDGGDINCNHIQPTGTILGKKSETFHGSNTQDAHKIQYKEICGKCGAKRVDKQLGLEPTFQQYINKLCDIFDEVKRVLRKDGTLWVNIGDTYGQNFRGSNKNNCSKIQLGNKGTIDFMGKSAYNTNLPNKSLCNIPARFSIEMQNRGWILRNVIIWHKPNCMPSSVKDRFTVDFEYLYFFVKSKKYWFETQFEDSLTPGSKSGTLKENMSEPTGKICGYNHSGKDFITSDKRNKRAVWKIATKPFKEAHFATYPEALCETPIKAGCPVGGIVLDPFFGAGTTGLVAMKQNKSFIGIELNPEYCKIAEARINKAKGDMGKC